MRPIGAWMRNRRMDAESTHVMLPPPVPIVKRTVERRHRTPPSHRREVEGEPQPDHAEAEAEGDAPGGLGTPCASAPRRGAFPGTPRIPKSRSRGSLSRSSRSSRRSGTSSVSGALRRDARAAARREQQATTDDGIDPQEQANAYRKSQQHCSPEAEKRPAVDEKRELDDEGGGQGVDGDDDEAPLHFRTPRSQRSPNSMRRSALRLRHTSLSRHSGSRQSAQSPPRRSAGGGAPPPARSPSGSPRGASGHEHSPASACSPWPRGGGTGRGAGGVMRRGAWRPGPGGLDLNAAISDMTRSQERVPRVGAGRSPGGSPAGVRKYDGAMFLLGKKNVFLGPTTPAQEQTTIIT